MPLPQFTLVLGGASSGKSAFAESLCFQSGKPRVYVATAQAFDDEMRQKISAHQIQRGPEWLTVEAPLDVSGALATCDVDGVVLLDCATLWLSNVMLAEQDVLLACDGFLAAITGCSAQVVVVSNEVGQGVVPDTSLGRQFRGAQGRLNQMMAKDADLVVNVIAGLPQTLKGTLP